MEDDIPDALDGAMLAFIGALFEEALAQEAAEGGEAAAAAAAPPAAAPPVRVPLPRQPRIFAPRIYLDKLRDSDVRRKFRLERGTILHLYQLIADKIDPDTQRGHAVPGMARLLATLYILGRGSFQATSGSIMGISQPTVSRVFMLVINAIVDIVPNFIHWPQNENEWNEVKLGFYLRAHMPQILGAIDGTHIAIRPPRSHEVEYRNRKQYHSLNVQLVCDAKQRIMSVNTGHPGSCHDSSMLRTSTLYEVFESGQMPEGWLIGKVFCLNNINCKIT